MSQFTDTLIANGVGAAGAITGGLLSAWLVSSRAEKAAGRARREGRREQGLIQMRASLDIVRKDVVSLLYEVETNPKQTDVPSRWKEIVPLLDAFEDLWNQRLSSLIDLEDIEEEYAEAFVVSHVARQAIQSVGGLATFLKFLEDYRDRIIRIRDRTQEHLRP